jgi:plasmid stabilization system protein ParE
MPVRRFPYALYYLVEGDWVTVTRVLHDRQDLSNLD